MTVNDFLNFSFGSLTVQMLLGAVLLVLFGIVLAKIILRILKKILTKTTMDESLQNVMFIICRIVVYALVVLVVVDYFGIPVTSLLTVLSIVGLAVSLAIQDSLANVFSGMLLLASKVFSSGDYVQLDGLEGTVIRVDLMNTHLRTADNKTVRIPNSEVQTAPIVNFSREPLRRVEIRVNVSYDDDTETVKQALLKAVQNAPTALAEPAPFAGLFAYRSSSIEYVLQAWTDSSTYWPTYYALTEGVRETLKQAGVCMTYDHINVHMIPTGKGE